jgi:hypothetical protein
MNFSFALRIRTPVIAIGEAAGNDHQIGSLRQRGVGMPDHRGLLAGDELERARHIALAVDSGKDENGGFHGVTGVSGGGTNSAGALR